MESFSVDRNGVQCRGLVHQASMASAEACVRSCCDDPGCEVWQWCPVMELRRVTAFCRAPVGQERRMIVTTTVTCLRGWAARVPCRRQSKCCVPAS